MRRQARLRSVALANIVTASERVRVQDWQGTMLMVSGPTGRTEMAKDIGDLWSTIGTVLGRAVDPLDPDLLDRLGE